MATEKRLIDANEYPCNTCDISYCYKNCDKFNAWLENTVDAVEVVYGRWETNCDPEECEKDFYCSVCEELICDFDTTALYPGQNCYYYCPNCGAKMDGDGNDTATDKT